MDINSIVNSYATTVILADKNSIPPLGTPHRATYDADNAPNGEALNLHTAALKAWNEYQVASFGGAMLRNHSIRYHERKIAEHR